MFKRAGRSHVVRQERACPIRTLHLCMPLKEENSNGRSETLIDTPKCTNSSERGRDTMSMTA